ncbi:hypothetical protein MRX96_030917 [Rhipicephalus microplus]
MLSRDLFREHITESYHDSAGFYMIIFCRYTERTTSCAHLRDGRIPDAYVEGLAASIDGGASRRRRRPAVSCVPTSGIRPQGGTHPSELRAAVCQVQACANAAHVARQARTGKGREGTMVRLILTGTQTTPPLPAAALCSRGVRGKPPLGATKTPPSKQYFWKAFGDITAGGKRKREELAFPSCCTCYIFRHISMYSKATLLKGTGSFDSETQPEFTRMRTPRSDRSCV